MVEMNGGPEKCAFPSVSLSVAMPKVDPRFGTGAQADSGANGHPSFWLREAIQREGERREGSCFGHYHYYNGQQGPPLGVD